MSGCYHSITDGVSYSGLSDGVVTSLGSGSATITGGNTNVTVTHGMGRTPKVTVEPKGQGGVQNWVSNIGNTTFKINITAPQGANVDFDYIAK